MTIMMFGHHHHYHQQHHYPASRLLCAMTGLAWGIGFECIVCAVVLQQYWSYPLWVYKHVLVLGLLFEIFCIPSYLALYYPKMIRPASYKWRTTDSLIVVVPAHGSGYNSPFKFGSFWCLTAIYKIRLCSLPPLPPLFIVGVRLVGRSVGRSQYI